MNLTQMNYLVTIERKGNLTSAAEELFISQPSLSQFLTKTEKELGFPLFRRVSNRMYPTIVGQRYLRCAHDILELYENTMSELMDYSKNDYGELAIGITIERGFTSMHKIYTKFNQLYPNINLQYYEDSPQALREMVISGQIDLTLNIMSKTPAELICVPLLTTELVLCIRNGHPLLSSPDFLLPDHTVNLETLRNYSMIKFRHGTQARVCTDQYLNREGLHPSVLLQTSSILTVCNMVSVTDSFAFLFDMHIQPQKGLLYFRLRNVPIYEFCGLIKRGRTLNRIMKQYLETLKPIFIEEHENCLKLINQTYS
ncbi:MAG: LysR family transcriptional regulator [Lachnospiraceae bacterium]|nr:LysR family transcriptional regulator [Lachnospiraceae bacterium]